MHRIKVWFWQLLTTHTGVSSEGQTWRQQQDCHFWIDEESVLYIHKKITKYNWKFNGRKLQNTDLVLCSGIDGLRWGHIDIFVLVLYVITVWGQIVARKAIYFRCSAISHVIASYNPTDWAPDFNNQKAKKKILQSFRLSKLGKPENVALGWKNSRILV